MPNPLKFYILSVDQNIYCFNIIRKSYLNYLKSRQIFLIILWDQITLAPCPRVSNIITLSEEGVEFKCCKLQSVLDSKQLIMLERFSTNYSIHKYAICVVRLPIILRWINVFFCTQFFSVQSIKPTSKKFMTVVLLKSPKLERLGTNTTKILNLSHFLYNFWVGFKEKLSRSSNKRTKRF